jgi:hypothetical protein
MALAVEWPNEVRVWLYATIFPLTLLLIDIIH